MLFKHAVGPRDQLRVAYGPPAPFRQPAVISDRHAAPHVDLAGDGGRDECGAAFLQEANGALGFGEESVEISPPHLEIISNPLLF